MRRVEGAPERDRLLERLRSLDSCALSDALDLLGIDDGVAPGLVALTSHRRCAGRVVTVELGPASGDSKRVHLCAGAVASGQQGDVVVVAHQGRTDCAGWGGNLSRAAVRQGLAGVIVHGAVRDVDEAAGLGFPVFGTAATPQTARDRAEEVSWGKRVVIAGVEVDTGDWVAADRSGVVFVRSSDVDAVVAAAEGITSKEAGIAARLDAGTAVTEVLGVDYETMLRRDDGDE